MATATIQMREISIRQMQDLSADLISAHWRELCKDRDRRKLAPDWDRYYDLERAGLIHSIGAWDGEDLVGYSVNILSTHLHYRDLLLLTNDLLYVADSARKASVGGRLIKATEQLARDLGAHEVTWHAKPGTALDVALSKSDAYSVMDTLYVRVV